MPIFHQKPLKQQNNPLQIRCRLSNSNELVVVVHRSLAVAQQEAANRTHRGCIALGVVVHHIGLGVAVVHRTGLGVAGVHHIVLEVGEANRIVLLMGVAVGRQEVDHREYEPHSLVAAVEIGIALPVGTVLVVGFRTALVVRRETEFLRMAAADVAVVVGVGCHIAD